MCRRCIVGNTEELYQAPSTCQHSRCCRRPLSLQTVHRESAKLSTYAVCRAAMRITENSLKGMYRTLDQVAQWLLRKQFFLLNLGGFDKPWLFLSLYSCSSGLWAYLQAKPIPGGGPPCSDLAKLRRHAPLQAPGLNLRGLGFRI